MDIFSQLGLGLSVALSWPNIAAYLLGLILGFIFVLHILPNRTLALILPVSLMLPESPGLFILMGVFLGILFGRALLQFLTLPSEIFTWDSPIAPPRPDSIAVKLAANVAGCAFGAVAGTVLLMMLAPPLMKVAQAFDAMDRAALLIAVLCAPSCKMLGAPRHAARLSWAF
jgi:putative tricarboxylic transport membrane protein